MLTVEEVVQHFTYSPNILSLYGV